MILTKLHIPHVGINLIHRSELFEKLNSGLSRRLILVSAPAGYGKTSLLSDWISQKKIPAAWLSLDNGDNDPAVFLGYFISGIQRFQSDFGQSARQLLNSPNSPSVEAIASLLINEILPINQNFLMVLDDFHLIKNGEILKFVTYLLDHIPGNIHIVILTRFDPELAVPKLRSQQQLVELRASDLSFSTNEISLLFNKKLRLGLSADDVYSLESKTEGWIAGLHLVALSMEGREDIPEFVRDFKGDNRYIMDYLIEEVLKIQSDETKEFLMQTSILQQLSAPLCNAVLNRNDSQLILETLEKYNMFIIPLDDERYWYRYHHLFADLLKQRFLQKDRNRVAAIHLKACLWFEENSFFELALEHALEIKNYEKSIQILEGIVESMWENGQHSAILRYGHLLPDEIITKSPVFSLYYSWILITTGRNKDVEKFLESAEKYTRSVISDQRSTKELVLKNKILSGKISIALAYMKLFSAPAEIIINYGKAAIEDLGGNNPLWTGWAWYFIGNAELERGEPEKGLDALNCALQNSKKTSNLYLMATITTAIAARRLGMGQYKEGYKQCADILFLMQNRGYSHIAKAEWTFSGLFTMMSVIQYIWTEFDEALEKVKTAYELCKNEKNIRFKIMALLAYSYILHAIEDKPGANEKLIELEDVMKQNKISPYLASTYIGWKLYLLIEMGQINLASDFAKEMGLGLHLKKNFETSYSYIFYARLLLLQNKYVEAEELMAEIYSIAKKAKGTERLVHLKHLYALMYLMKDDHEKAVENYIEAMEMAVDENLLLYFIFDLDITNEILNDVYRIQAAGKTGITDNFIQKLKQAVETKKNHSKIYPELGLSLRELETLKLLAQELSNQEIADRLFISINTVKTHLKNIFLKLEADSRSGTVAKAKKMGIL
jgi:LuxR family maltose regulon positive regulatory protein